MSLDKHAVMLESPEEHAAKINLIINKNRRIIVVLSVIMLLLNICYAIAVCILSQNNSAYALWLIPIVVSMVFAARNIATDMHYLKRL